jgi:hypothetical protein
MGGEVANLRSRLRARHPKGPKPTDSPWGGTNASLMVSGHWAWSSYPAALPQLDFSMSCHRPERRMEERPWSHGSHHVKLWDFKGIGGRHLHDTLESPIPDPLLFDGIKGLHCRNGKGARRKQAIRLYSPGIQSVCAPVPRSAHTLAVIFRTFAHVPSPTPICSTPASPCTPAAPLRSFTCNCITSAEFVHSSYGLLGQERPARLTDL